MVGLSMARPGGVFGCLAFGNAMHRFSPEACCCVHRFSSSAPSWVKPTSAEESSDTTPQHQYGNHVAFERPIVWLACLSKLHGGVVGKGHARQGLTHLDKAWCVCPLCPRVPCDLPSISSAARRDCNCWVVEQHDGSQPPACIGALSVGARAMDGMAIRRLSRCSQVGCSRRRPLFHRVLHRVAWSGVVILPRHVRLLAGSVCWAAVCCRFASHPGTGWAVCFGNEGAPGGGRRWPGRSLRSSREARAIAAIIAGGPGDRRG